MLTKLKDYKKSKLGVKDNTKNYGLFAKEIPSRKFSKVYSKYTGEDRSHIIGSSPGSLDSITTTTTTSTTSTTTTETPITTTSTTSTTTTETPTTTTTTTSTTTTTTIPPNTFNVTNNGSGNYIINGSSNPTIALTEGQTYTFNISAVGHPFWIKTNLSTGTGNQYNSGVTNNGTDNGTITFIVPYDVPATLYYNCQFHSSMAGTIDIIDVPTTTTTSTTTSTTTILSYTIGDSALGGKIAYILQSGDPGYVVGEQHGLVTTMSDTSTGAFWGCEGSTITGADGVLLGTGNQNTIDILAECGVAGIAAKLCSDLVQGGYSDWYLPSKDELNKLYLNKVAIGSFGGTYYWCSTEDSGTNAKIQDFGSGFQGSSNKDSALYVRAVRSF